MIRLCKSSRRSKLLVRAKSLVLIGAVVGIECPSVALLDSKLSTRSKPWA